MEIKDTFRLLDIILRPILAYLLLRFRVYFSKILGFDYSFNIITFIAFLITLIIVRNLKSIRKMIYKKYFYYYFILFILLTFCYSYELDKVFNIFYKNGVREEIFYRFFMIGIFIKYKNKLKFNKYLFYVYSLTINLFFTISHNVSYLQLVYLYFVGLIFIEIFLYNGVFNSILSHTIHNYGTNSIERGLSLLIILIPIFYQRMVKEGEKEGILI